MSQSTPPPPQLTDAELAAIIRPHRADYYRRLIGQQNACAKKLAVSPDTIQTYLGQTRGHTGTYNAYEFRHGEQAIRYTGHHQPTAVKNTEFLVGPISRDRLLQWWSECPDFRDSTIYRQQRLVA